ncbi:hypothetical protein CONPUDRAFT_137352 [Coniophora puteana RWD-64-598 SS2]|uniref:RING-type domain-containing protein n=1 Tax=Coniophora puteana (strain RWD-64-598) TaxID=741705 RepID=A0A5M3MS34_CONPW|nr:uncharacterized protein CONPUDRAFT_137352 [Coniophora puteana RWD-64-598 SS2]EIW81361.1 hypothetical protein CONPUDRAFT_137352 [Coniophora puteana RWD-64-598 SS2]
MVRTNSRGIKEDSQGNAVGGSERIVSYRGLSQFQGRSASACGLACLNFARHVLERRRNGESTERILQEISWKESMEEILAITSGWTDDSHLEVDQIEQLPLFKSSLKLVHTQFGQPTKEHFRSLLRHLERIPSSCAVAVITRPPEIIACLKVIVSGSNTFVIFDSHPRPDHSDGAALIFVDSIDKAAVRLSTILPYDEALMSDSHLHWQAQLLGQFSSHTFVARELDTSPMAMMYLVAEASLDILSLQTKVSTLESRNSSVLTSENQRLEKRMEQMEDTRTALEIQLRELAAAPFRKSPLHPDPSAKNAEAGPSRLPPSASVGNPRSEDGPQHDSIQQFNQEDRLIRQQHDIIATSQIKPFECNICFEEQSEDFAVRLRPCGHPFCRTCAKEFIVSNINEHRFPVLCPVCSAEKAEKPSVVDSWLVEQIGVNQDQYSIWTEMELAQFSILIHCRGCKRSVFIDRQDHDDTKMLACPLPRCNYVWCKACQCSIQIGGPSHSCDGSSELDHLMKQRGWKYCPSCKTPCEKVSGCNHMICISPGCT